MFIWLIIFLFTCGFSCLYTYISILNDMSYYFIVLWIVLAFLTTIIILFLYLLFIIYVLFPHLKKGSKVLQRLCYPWVVFVNRVAKIHLKVEGKENIPNETFVIFANHKSMLDITCIYEAVNRPISAVAKQELGEVPFLKKLIKDLYVVCINRNNDREAVKSMVTAIKYVKGGLNFFIFPEGGIKSREIETMNDLRAGAYKLATKPKAIILPVSIIGASKLTTNAFKKRTNIKIIFHKPVYYEAYKNYNTHEIGEHIGNIINEGVTNENK